MAGGDVVQLVCPYNAAHQVPAREYNRHILQCRTKYLEGKSVTGGASQLVSCPYNARHLVPGAEYALHVRMCSSKQLCQQVEAEMQRLAASANSGANTSNSQQTVQSGSTQNDLTTPAAAITNGDVMDQAIANAEDTVQNLITF